MKKPKLTGDWTWECWFPLKIIRRWFGAKLGDWVGLTVVSDVKKNTVTINFNGVKFVTGRKKMSLKQFQELIKKG